MLVVGVANPLLYGSKCLAFTYESRFDSDESAVT